MAERSGPPPAPLLADVVACIGFFTRLPVAAWHAPRPDFARSLWAAPVAGLAVGAVSGIGFWLASQLSIPATLAATVALAVAMLVTGCLHEDGLADVADGFGGGATRERKLEIMKDSRIGAFGVAALAISLLARWSALTEIAAPGAVLTALLAAHAASRALLPAFMAHVPPARSTGLSAGAGEIGFHTAGTALLIGAAALALLGSATAISAAVALAALFVFMKWLALRQIGGQTGDVLGALQQGAEVIVLFAATVHFSN